MNLAALAVTCLCLISAVASFSCMVGQDSPGMAFDGYQELDCEEAVMIMGRDPSTVERYCCFQMRWTDISGARDHIRKGCEIDVKAEADGNQACYQLENPEPYTGASQREQWDNVCYESLCNRVDFERPAERTEDGGGSQAGESYHGASGTIQPIFLLILIALIPFIFPL